MHGFLFRAAAAQLFYLMQTAPAVFQHNQSTIRKRAQILAFRAKNLSRFNVLSTPLTSVFIEFAYAVLKKTLFVKYPAETAVMSCPLTHILQFLLVADFVFANQVFPYFVANAYVQNRRALVLPLLH